MDTNGNVYVCERANATIRMVTPEGVVTTLPVNVKIDNDKNTKLGAREIKIKLGVTTLQTLTGFEVKPKAVTAKRVPATGQPATQQPAKVPAGNPFEL